MSGVLLLSSLAALAMARPQGPVTPVSSMPAPTGTEAAASSTITVSGVPTDGPGNGTDFPGLAPVVPQSASSPELPFRILADTKDPRVAGLQFMAAEGYFWLGRMDAANNTAIQVNNSQAFMVRPSPWTLHIFSRKHMANLRCSTPLPQAASAFLSKEMVPSPLPQPTPAAPFPTAVSESLLA